MIMVKKISAVFILCVLCAALFLGCAMQAPGIQSAVGNSSVERTDKDGTVTKTSGGEISVPFAGLLKSLIDAAAKFIPGNGSSETVVNVGVGAEVEE